VRREADGWIGGKANAVHRPGDSPSQLCKSLFAAAATKHHWRTVRIIEARRTVETHFEWRASHRRRRHSRGSDHAFGHAGKTPNVSKRNVKQMRRLNASRQPMPMSEFFADLPHTQRYILVG
jgi:hypothetical protein